MQLRRAPSSPAPVEAEAETAPEVADFGSNADFAASVGPQADDDGWLATDSLSGKPNNAGLDEIRDALKGPPTIISVNAVDPADILSLGFVEIEGAPGARWFQHPKGHVVQLVAGRRGGDKVPDGGDAPDWIRPRPYEEMESRKALIRDQANVAAKAEQRWRRLRQAGATYDDLEAVGASTEAMTARNKLKDMIDEALSLEDTWIDEINELEEHGEAADWDALGRAMDFFRKEGADNERRGAEFRDEFMAWVAETTAPIPVDGSDEVPRLEIPDIPGLEIPDVPGLEIPDVPGLEIPDVPGLEIPDVPGLEIPDVPGLEPPDVPGLQVPDVPELDVPDFGALGVPDAGQAGLGDDDP